MKITVLEEKENFARFMIEDADSALVNSIRREALVGVPTMSIEEVDFLKNSSVLYDEIIAHRLGLIPLKTDLKGYKLPSKCKCAGKGCAVCQVKMTLNEKGPKIVCSGSLKSKDPKVVPVMNDMPIVKLNAGQELKFNATAVLGVGAEHTKWSTGHIVQFNYPKVVGGKKASELKEPKNAKETNEFLQKVKLLETSGEIQTEIEPGKFVFEIESWGQLEPKQIVATAISNLSDRLKQFEKAMK